MKKSIKSASGRRGKCRKGSRSLSISSSPPPRPAGLVRRRRSLRPSCLHQGAVRARLQPLPRPRCHLSHFQDRRVQRDVSGQVNDFVLFDCKLRQMTRMRPQAAAEQRAPSCAAPGRQHDALQNCNVSYISGHAKHSPGRPVANHHASSDALLLCPRCPKTRLDALMRVVIPCQM